jgi:hypothetical protein
VAQAVQSSGYARFTVADLLEELLNLRDVHIVRGIP